eukprot:Phypoly_transcript_01340.p1 GENE.Phypoly_transcript_01340~~Phypoly_transcript_01340.p1  ORF type:complete len:1070 (+),score=142.73 Phypoly_transcript_01340:227-3436(+)
MAKVLYGWSKDDIHQGLLEQVVRALFLGEDVSKNVRKGASIKSPSTGNYLELDVWVPNQNICFEFQDPYHYITTWDNQSPLSLIKENDRAKREAAIRKGDTLVVVPCWWDGKDQSLVGTIIFQRPDLLPKWHGLNLKPISLNPPRFFFGGGKIPDVGELMLASFPVSVQFGSSISFESFWWMGEKYDGIRFCWNSRRNTVFSRAGLIVELEDCFYPHFPKKMFLDGEVWFGRGTFQDSQRLIVADEEPIAWEYMRLVTFDDPTPVASDLEFEKRYGNLLALISKASPAIIVAPRVKCVTKRQLANMAQSVILEGGEGVVLRKPKSIYENGRSAFLLKIKATRGDKEALVVTANPAFTELQLPDGNVFTVPSLKSHSAIKLKRGDVVTFVYTTFSRNSLPTHSRILRIRSDISWEDVLRDYEEQTAQELSLNETSRNLVEEKKSNKPRDVWLSDKEKTMREILEGYAKSHNRDPLVPDNWYHIKHQILLKLQGGRAIVQHYEGNYIDALMGLFPDIGLDKTKFKSLPRNYWGDLANRREFFREFAANEGFDALLPENWYNMNVTRFQSYKGGFAVLSYYEGDWTKALIHVFPDIGLDKSKLTYVPRTFWHVSDRKNIFLDFARYKGFDPTNFSNWYMVRKEEIFPYKDMKSVLEQHYEGSLLAALKHLFPSFDKMPRSPTAFWKDKKNQRAVFEAIAKAKGFDPLVAENWYSLKYDTVISFKGGTSTLSHYDGSYGNALVTLFPNIGLDLEKFEKVPKKHWYEFNNQKRFFMNFANANNFDPLVAKNWHKITKEEIAFAKGGKTILKLFDHSLPKALRHVFPEVSFTEADFHRPLADDYLNSAPQRRKFFELFAREKGFNPLEPVHWYNVSVSSVLAKKGARAIMGVYDGNLPNALKKLFPEVSFDRSRFVRLSRKHYWCDLENQRKFFRSYARIKGFLPNKPENWYDIQPSEIINRRGGKALLRHYGGNLRKALMRVFPNIGLQEVYFSSLPHEHWVDPTNRRAIFEKFAEHNKFDPLVANNWYSYTRRSVGAMKGARLAMDFYGGNLANSLMSLFPEVDFDEKQFVDP